MFRRTIFSTILFCSLVSCALCASPIGTWVGSYKLDMAKIKMPADPQQKAMAKATIDAVKAMKFTFILRSDKTFRMEMRSVQAGKARVQVSEGKYVFTGNKVVSTTFKRDGKAVPANDQTINTLVMSKDGNTLVHTKSDPQLKGHIELKRVKK